MCTDVCTTDHIPHWASIVVYIPPCSLMCQYCYYSILRRARRVKFYLRYTRVTSTVLLLCSSNLYFFSGHDLRGTYCASIVRVRSAPTTNYEKFEEHEELAQVLPKFCLPLPALNALVQLLMAYLFSVSDPFLTFTLVFYNSESSRLICWISGTDYISVSLKETIM